MEGMKETRLKVPNTVAGAARFAASVNDISQQEVYRRLLSLVFDLAGPNGFAKLTEEDPDKVATWENWRLIKLLENGD